MGYVRLNVLVVPSIWNPNVRSEGEFLTPSTNARRSWHVRANGLVFLYALLGLLTLVGPVHFAAHRWLVVHLFLLGAVTNAIVTWTEHFTITLLRVPQPSRRQAGRRLAALNLAVIATLVGVSIANSELIIVGAGLLMLVIAIHGYNLHRLSNRALQNRFAGTVHFYLVAATCLLLGVVFGALSAFQKDGSVLRDSLHVAHLHANLLGWVGVTVMGTLFTFWPTVLRTKMVDGVMKSAKRSLPFLFTGISVAAISLAMNQRYIAIFGMILYALGIGFVSRPFIRTWRQKAPRDLATVSIFCSALWLSLGVLSDLVALTLGRSLSDYVSWVDRFIPAFLMGFVGQILVGALTFLVPVILGGGPAAVRGHIKRLSSVWRTRIFLFNVGAVFTIFEGRIAQIGYGLLAVSLGFFIILVLKSVRAERGNARAV